MTFEEWWEEDTSHIDIYRAAKSAWNAAIAESIKALKPVCYWPEDPKEKLRKLLTAS